MQYINKKLARCQFIDSHGSRVSHRLDLDSDELFTFVTQINHDVNTYHRQYRFDAADLNAEGIYLDNEGDLRFPRDILIECFQGVK